jgi:hypothetical protein
VLCGIDKIPKNIPHIHTECEKYLGIFGGVLLVPQNIIMNMNNVMLLINGTTTTIECRPVNTQK